MKVSRNKDRIVAIVGRPNVGKSALFNRLAGRRIAIVHDMPGVTRDRLTAPVKGSRIPLQVMDTGGIGATLEDSFGAMVRVEAEIAIAAADVILFVVDALAGMHPIDQSVAELLRRQGKPVILGLNKADDPKHDHILADFGRLGFKLTAAFSAEHGRGIDRLIRVCEEAAPPVESGPSTDTEPPADGEEGQPAPQAGKEIRLAIIGRPNVGKSSLFNAILKDDRAMVSEIAGTTRDSIDSDYTHRGQRYLLIDTAGIRKKAKIDTSVEAYSVARSERSIRRADLCALVIDAERGVAEQERKIAGTILEENKPCIIIANKFDLFLPDGTMKERLEALEDHVRRELFFLHYAPLVAVSAKEGMNLSKIFGAIDLVKKASDNGMSTGQFNRLLQDAIERTPPPHVRGRRFKLLYATLAREEMPRPIMAPRVVLFVNHEDLMPATYRRYLENTVRGSMEYEGLPIRFDIRAREKRQGNVRDLWKPDTRGTGGRQGRRKEDAVSGRKVKEQENKGKETEGRPPRLETAFPARKSAAKKSPSDRKPSAKRPASKRPAAKRPAGKRPAAKRPAGRGAAAKRPAPRGKTSLRQTVKKRSRR
ncbi:MAG: small GTP-binding protein [Verrucomicrobiales bacterium]|nr:small GTP-binding protein [Verrucomicrobiales bacterium]